MDFKMEETVLLNHTVSGRAHLMRAAQVAGEMDKFHITITCNSNGKTIETEYSTGIGHRYKGFISNRNMLDWKVKAPKLLDVLHAMVSDAQVIEYLSPTADPIDAMMAEMGFKKASEARAAVDGCRDAYKKIRILFPKLSLEQLIDHFQDY
jgi:hypothetical protein